MLAGRQAIRGRQGNEAGEARRGSPARPVAAASPAWTYLAPVHLERPGAPVQHKGCSACSSDEPCSSCGGGGLVASSGTQHRRHAPSHDPAERQADEIGARIAADLGGVGELSSGELPHGVRAVAERHLGTRLDGTRLIGGAAGHERATRERAYALTEGSSVHFLGGQLTTRTPHGRFLLGHELTHVAQQRAARRPHPAQKLSWDDVTGAVGDVASGLASGAGEVASGVASGVSDVAHGVASGVSDVAGGVASGVSDAAHGVASGVSDVAGGVATGVGDVAHGIATGDPLGGLARGASSVAGGVASGAGDVAGGVAAGAHDVAGGIGAGINDVAGGVAAGASDVMGGLRRGAASVAGGLASGAGRILGGLGLGITPAPGGGFLITIPDIDLCEPHDMPVIDSPEWSMFVPLYGGAVPIGPVVIGGALGFTVRYRMQLMMALGPCVLRHIAVLIDPLGGRYGGTAQLYVAAALGPRLTLSGALAAMGGIVIPTVPPITLIAGVEGGLRGTGRASALGAIQSTVAVLYSGGRLSFSATNDLMAALHLRGDLDAYVAATVFNRIVCEYVWNLLSWEGGPAWRLRIPITAGVGGGAPAAGRIGPITWGMIPISTIANAIQGTVPGKHCMTWREILRMLCEATAIPDSICKVLLPDEDEGDGDEEDDDPSSVGPLKDVKASGRCKCVGDAACGGGRIYEFTFSTKKGCKNAQKDADDCCNNNDVMKQRCVRPNCYYRHTGPTCPDESNDAPPCPGRQINAAGPSGGPPFIPAPAPGVNPPVPPPPGVGVLAHSNRIRVQLQHKSDDVVPSVAVEKDSAVTVADGHAAVDTLMDRTSKSVNKVCKQAAGKMKSTMSGYPPTGVSAIGNVARKKCSEHPDYERGIRMDLENLAGTNFTS
jgi:hypothetical protein